MEYAATRRVGGPLLQRGWGAGLALHRFLVTRAFYALLFASVPVYALFAVRVERTGSWHYRWLVWNLLLAWVPYCASLLAEWLRARRPERPWRLLAPAAI